jgi:hypothetical protein
MAQAKSVQFHRRAAMALDAFSARDRALIEGAARQLVAPDSKASVRSKTAKLAIPEPMYVMRAAPAIRLIYRETTEGIEILDVVKKATLQTFLKNSATPAPAARPATHAEETPANSAVSVKRTAEAVSSGRAKAEKPHAKKPVGTA